VGIRASDFAASGSTLAANDLYLLNPDADCIIGTIPLRYFNGLFVLAIGPL
jgi:hypothetical protein